MEYSPYLDLNRDLETLHMIVAKYEYEMKEETLSPFSLLHCPAFILAHSADTSRSINLAS